MDQNQPNDESRDQDHPTESSELDPLEDAELLTELLRAFVRYPKDVRVESKTGEHSILLTIYLNPDDIGVVIGRDHATIMALRHIFVKIAVAQERRMFMHIAGSEQNEPRNDRNDRNGYRLNEQSQGPDRDQSRLEGMSRPRNGFRPQNDRNHSAPRGGYRQNDDGPERVVRPRRQFR